MKKTSKIVSMVLAASLLAGAVLPSSLPERRSLEKTVLRCNVGGYPETKKSYALGEIHRIIHEVYMCTPSKPDYFSEKFVREIIKQESGYNSQAISRKGASGLMQIMPDAWSDVEKRLNYHKYVFDPRINTEVGIKYFLLIDKEFEKKYDGWEKLTSREKRRMVLPPYNAGLSKFEGKRWDLEKMPRETRSYVANIINGFEGIGNRLP